MTSSMVRQEGIHCFSMGGALGASSVAAVVRQLGPCSQRLPSPVSLDIFLSWPLPESLCSWGGMCHLSLGGFFLEGQTHSQVQS